MPFRIAFFSSPAHAVCTPTLSSPAAGTVWDGGNGTASPQTFSWTGSGCTEYRLQVVGNGGSWSNPADVTSTTWAPFLSRTFATAVWDAEIAGDWAPGLRWRVQGKDSGGTITTTSARPLLIDYDSDDYASGLGYEPNSQGVNLGDCDDRSTSEYPGAPETCGNGVDEDCDDGGFRGVVIGTNNGSQFFSAYDLLTDSTAFDDYIAWLNSINANWVGIYVGMQYLDAIDTDLTMIKPADITTCSTSPCESDYAIWTWDDAVLQEMTEKFKSEGFKVYWAIALDPLDDNGTPTNGNDDGDGSPDRDMMGYRSTDTDYIGDIADRGPSAGYYTTTNWIWDQSDATQIAAVADFWASYTANAVDIATFAQSIDGDGNGQSDVDMIGLGVETDGLFRYSAYPTEITDLFDAVDDVYKGMITYDMHWDRYSSDVSDPTMYDDAMEVWYEVPFDVIGISAWIQLYGSTYSTPLADSVYSAEWDAILADRLDDLHADFPDKPIVFTEFGYVDYVDAGYSVDEHQFETRGNATQIGYGQTTQSDILETFYANRDDAGTSDDCDIVQGTFLWNNLTLADAGWDNEATSGYTIGVRNWTHTSTSTAYSASTTVVDAAYSAWGD